MRIVELILDEEQEIGIEAISVVENPAIEEDFIALLHIFLKRYCLKSLANVLNARQTKQLNLRTPIPNKRT